jgi:hypothetical protein
VNKYRMRMSIALYVPAAWDLYTQGHLMRRVGLARKTEGVDAAFAGESGSDAGAEVRATTLLD